MARNPRTYQAGLDLLANLLDGKALPPSKTQRAKDEADSIRKRNADLIECALIVAPLVASVSNYKCACGNDWQIFNGYGRLAKTRQEQAGAVEVFRLLESKPIGEKPVKTIFADFTTDHCIKCFND